MATIQNLFDPVVQRALPLSKGADLRISIFDNKHNPPQPWPDGTAGMIEINYGTESLFFEGVLVEGRLEFVLDNLQTDSVPATKAANGASWRLRVAFADDPNVEIPVFEGPIYRNRHG